MPSPSPALLRFRALAFPLLAVWLTAALTGCASTDAAKPQADASGSTQAAAMPASAGPAPEAAATPAAKPPEKLDVHQASARCWMKYDADHKLSFDQRATAVDKCIDQTMAAQKQAAPR